MRTLRTLVKVLFFALMLVTGSFCTGVTRLTSGLSSGIGRKLDAANRQLLCFRKPHSIRGWVALILGSFFFVISVPYAKAEQSSKKSAEVRGEVRIYCVKKNETLSVIAKDKFGNPIYAPDGSLEKIRQLNPQISNVDLIYPNEALLFGRDHQSSETPCDCSAKTDSSSEAIACPVLAISEAPVKPEHSVSKESAIKFSAATKYENYHLTSRVGSFDLEASSGLLFSAAVEGCLTNSLCVSVDAANFNLPGNSSTQVQNRSITLFTWGLKLDLFVNDPIRFWISTGLEDVPSFEVVDTNNLKIDKNTSRFTGIGLTGKYKHLTGTVSLLSFGSTSAADGPSSDFVQYSVRLSLENLESLRGFNLFADYKSADFESQRFKQTRRQPMLGISRTF